MPVSIPRDHMLPRHISLCIPLKPAFHNISWDRVHFSYASYRPMESELRPCPKDSVTGFCDFNRFRRFNLRKGFFVFLAARFFWLPTSFLFQENSHSLRSQWGFQSQCSSPTIGRLYDPDWTVHVSPLSQVTTPGSGMGREPSQAS